MIIFALSISGFFAFKIFNEMKEDCYVIVSGELNPKNNLAFFPSTEKMNWFEANRVMNYLSSSNRQNNNHEKSAAWVSMVSCLKNKIRNIK